MADDRIPVKYELLNDLEVKGIKMENHDFTSDRPIATIDDDLLDRRNFAESLSKAISGWKGRDSLIIALHGDWGSGKSSIKNMTLSAFPKLGLESPEIIEFNPWEWAGQDKISKSFFEELASSVGQVDKSKSRKKLAKKIKLYGSYLNSGATIVTGFTAALPTLFLLAAIFGFGSIFSNKELVKNISTFLLATTVGWAAFLKWGGKLAGQLGGLAEEHANLAEMSLEKLKKSLKKDLSNLKKPLLVVVDDIDRLTTEETRVVFQLVKANADFPNMVYLLLFQRDIVEAKLTDSTQQGRDYLEKIIQVPFDIPKIEQARLEKILFTNLDRILEEDQKILKRFDKTRWGNVYHGGLQAYFRTLRNVYRYTSTLSFHVSLLKGTKAFEVNPVDLIVIECFRVFEPDIYKALASSKSLVTSTDRHENANLQKQKELEGILQKSSPDMKEDVKSLLKQLFPPIEGLLGGMNYSSSFSDSWFKELRICHPDIFDRYFQFSIPQDKISQSDLDELLELTSKASELFNKLKELKDKGQLKAALSQLDTYKQDISLEYTDSFIPALMDIGDEVENESGGFTGFSSHMHIVRIVLWYLRQDDSPASRAHRLLTAFQKSSGLSVMRRLLAGDERRREKEDKDELILLDDDGLEEGKKEFVAKIATVASTNPSNLLSNRHLAALLHNWEKWGEVADIKTWVRNAVKDKSDLLSFLDSFTYQVISHGMGDHVARVKYQINLGSVEKYIPLEQLDDLRANADRTALSERHIQILEALDSAFTRRAKGYADDAWDDD